MTSFITTGILNVDDTISGQGGAGGGNDDLVSNPNNTARSDDMLFDGSSSMRDDGTKSEQFYDGESMPATMTTARTDDFDSKAATILSEDRRLSTAADSAAKTTSATPDNNYNLLFSSSGTSCELLNGLSTLEVNELTYPDFLLVQRLRCRAHCLLLHAVAHAVYLVNVFNGLRLKALDILHPETKYTRKITDLGHPDPVRIAIIGCGRLGRLIIKGLLTFGFVDPRSIRVGTRHPENNELLIQKGITMFVDNTVAVIDCQIVFVCVPPHLHIDVLKQLNAAIKNPAATTVVTFVPPFTAKKLVSYAPNLVNLIRPEYDLAEANQEQQNDWNCAAVFPEVFEYKPYVEVTCPLLLPSSSSKTVVPPVKSGQRLLETYFYAAYNHCCQLGLNWQQMMDCINIVIFNSKCDIDDHAVDNFLNIHNIVLNPNGSPTAQPPPSRSSTRTPIQFLAPDPSTTVTAGTKSRKSTVKSQQQQTGGTLTTNRTTTMTMGAVKSLTTIEIQIDNMLKADFPLPVSLIDVYSMTWTPFRSSLFEETDDAILTKRQTAFRRGYWQQFKRFLEWRKWNRPPDVSYIV